MRNHEDRQLALDCLRLAQGAPCCESVISEVMERAEAYFSFVSGAGADDAKHKLDAVREVLSLS